MLSLETRPYCRIRCLEDVGFLCTHVERVDESREYRRILEPRQNQWHEKVGSQGP